MLSIAITPDRVEAALAAGKLACPVCSEPLSPWGFARSREVRLLHETRSVTPRRARCAPCETTHVLAPSWLVPRRRDGAEVIGEALRLAADGAGHRVIARQLKRPAGTVRGWLRAGRRQAQDLRACGSKWLCSLDPDLGPVTPAGSELGDAVEANRPGGPRVGAAVWPGTRWRVGAGGVPDRRRAALRPGTVAAVARQRPVRASGSHRSPSHARGCRYRLARRSPTVTASDQQRKRSGLKRATHPPRSTPSPFDARLLTFHPLSTFQRSSVSDTDPDAQRHPRAETERRSTACLHLASDSRPRTGLDAWESDRRLLGSQHN